ncbi:c-type cytochrome [Piscinibacter koreensis]|uniref:C-type cytochrome n=1 Tax=Piscinibacter koreensis TaxID=2742824 RepID=A0A7Y6NJS3_9BURK|nr:c-type cytochrome [Schlegelella koreensis]NUZ04480.1 c-type cytochrome [Schlegelella koreensis]
MSLLPDVRPRAVSARGASRRVALAFAALAAVGASIAPPATAAGAPAFEDTIAQRVRACTGCHGLQGRATSDGYVPRIAGKPSGYLYHQLLNFRDGRRHYEPMNHLLRPLTDRYLREIADYFAGLQVPYPAPQPAPPDAVAARGRELVTRGDPALQVPACASCHGESLMGIEPASPGLVGLPRDYINAQLGAWRSGKRKAVAPDCMSLVAQRLPLEDIGAVSSWLAAQPVGAGAKPVRAADAQPMPLPCGSVLAEAPTQAPAGSPPPPQAPPAANAAGRPAIPAPPPTLRAPASR